MMCLNGSVNSVFAPLQGRVLYSGAERQVVQAVVRCRSGELLGGLVSGKDPCLHSLDVI